MTQPLSLTLRLMHCMCCQQGVCKERLCYCGSTPINSAAAADAIGHTPSTRVSVQYLGAKPPRRHQLRTLSRLSAHSRADTHKHSTSSTPSQHQQQAPTCLAVQRGLVVVQRVVSSAILLPLLLPLCCCS